MTAPSRIDIISTALVQVGHSPVTDLTDDIGNAARLIYNQTVRHFLSVHYWRFAADEAELSQLADTGDITEWDYAYTKPGDMLVPIGLTSFAPYEIYKDKVYTNESDDVRMQYIAEVSEGYFPPYFVNALVDELAYRYAMAIADNSQRASMLYPAAIRSLQIAKGKDSQAGQPASLTVAINTMLSRYPQARR